MGTVVKFGYNSTITNNHLYYRELFKDKSAPEISINEKYRFPVVFVELDNNIQIGSTNISVFENTPNIIAFSEKDFKLFKHYTRTQLPLDIAFARTIHSAQGVTAIEDIVYSVPVTNFCNFLSYVALSRCGSLKQLHLLGNYLNKTHFEISKEKKDAIENEYQRLREIKMLP
jgi:hypothetical protein